MIQYANLLNAKVRNKNTYTLSLGNDWRLKNKKLPSFLPFTLYYTSDFQML